MSWPRVLEGSGDMNPYGGEMCQPDCCHPSPHMNAGRVLQPIRVEEWPMGIFCLALLW